MIDTQLGRRNLTPIQKIAIAEKYRPIYEKKAKENKILSANMTNKKLGNTVTPISAEPLKPTSTRDALAKIAGIGHDTYNKGKKILDLEKNEEVLTENEREIINKTKLGEIKVNTAYKYVIRTE